MNRKRAAELASGDDVLEITPLGAGQEVGRSSIALRFASKRVLFDAGIHPGKSGFDALPFYDAIDDLAAIDVLLISHFHLDHTGTLAYFVTKTPFQGRIFMTHPTRAILSMVLRQSVRSTFARPPNKTAKHNVQ
jgi:cleavage and polyadenylation specificity factor subunit 3